MSSKKSLVIIGGGAAGFFCAVNAAKLNPALKVIILEKTGKVLSKVRISGGGRCNVTHACFDIAEMSRRYPRGANFVKKTFHQFFTADTVKWFEERGVHLKTEADGRIFPVTDSSQTIIDCLHKEVNRFGVQIMMNAEVVSLKPENGKFTIELTDSRNLICDFVCIACGGYPKSSMFDWLKNLGHSIEEPVPSLFTFNLSADHPITQLMGVSVDNVRIKIAGTKLEQQGPLLITHWGFSGPAVLKLSAWGARELQQRKWNFEIMVNWLPALNDTVLRDHFISIRQTHAAQKIMGKNAFGLPNRLWDFFAVSSGVTNDMRWADLPSVIQNKIHQTPHCR